MSFLCCVAVEVFSWTASSFGLGPGPQTCRVPRLHSQPRFLCHIFVRLLSGCSWEETFSSVGASKSYRSKKQIISTHLPSPCMSTHRNILFMTKVCEDVCRALSFIWMCFVTIGKDHIKKKTGITLNTKGCDQNLHLECPRTRLHKLYRNCEIGC